MQQDIFAYSYSAFKSNSFGQFLRREASIFFILYRISFTDSSTFFYLNFLSHFSEKYTFILLIRLTFV